MIPETATLPPVEALSDDMETGTQVDMLVESKEEPVLQDIPVWRG